MKLVSPFSLRGAWSAAVPLLFLAGCAVAPTRHTTAEFAGPSTAEAGQVLPRAAATNRLPVYPYQMRRSGTPAWVNVHCVIDETGRVLVASVENSTNEAFNESTLDAVRGWTFTPGTRDGVATAMRVRLPVEYVMER